MGFNGLKEGGVLKAHSAMTISTYRNTSPLQTFSIPKGSYLSDTSFQGCFFYGSNDKMDKVTM